MILDVTRGEYVCTSCATVVDVLYLPSRSMYEYEPIYSKPHMDLSEATDSEGNPSRELPLLKKLKALNSRINRTKDLTIIRCVHQVGSRLGLEEVHIRFALRACKLIVARLREVNYEVNVTSCKIAAAAILYTILKFNLPISVKDVVSAFREFGHRVSVTDIIDILRAVFGRFFYDVRERVLTYILSLASKCGIDDSKKTQLVKMAARIIRRLRDLDLSGKNPRTLAATIFAYCVLSLGLKISILDIASQLDVSPLTLKEHIRRLQKILANRAVYCGIV